MSERQPKRWAKKRHNHGLSCWQNRWCHSSFTPSDSTLAIIDYSVMSRFMYVEAGNAGWVIGHFDGQGQYGCPSCASTLYDAGDIGLADRHDLRKRGFTPPALAPQPENVSSKEGGE